MTLSQDLIRGVNDGVARVDRVSRRLVGDWASSCIEQCDGYEALAVGGSVSGCQANSMSKLFDETGGCPCVAEW